MRFRASGFGPVRIGDLYVHPMFRAYVNPGDVFRVTWLSAASSPTQGITLRMRMPGVARRRGEGGLLRSGGVESSAIVLWADKERPYDDVECASRRDGAELWISNRWRGQDGVVHEWLENFGMVVEDLAESGVLLRCSDGDGAPDFTALVVRIELRKPDGRLARFQRAETVNVVAPKS
jgi:hypothetical protein